MSDDSTKMVIFDPASMDDKALAEQQTRLERLAAIPDEEIDLSDIPETTDEQWATAFRPGLHRPIKLPITIRLDADVVNWFKENAHKGRYQTDINRVLRAYVERQQRFVALKKKVRVKSKAPAKARAQLSRAERTSNAAQQKKRA